MSNIYLKVTIVKDGILKFSIFQVWKIRLQINFSGVPTRPDII